jgi:hypothetical protein
MMVSQFKRGTGGPGLGFAAKDGSVARFGKVGECSGLTPSEKPSPTPKIIKTTPTKPIIPMRDGVIDEPVRASPQKQVWHPKPNRLRNTLDTFPDISSDPFPRAPQPSKKKAPSHKQNPPKREVRCHCEYCESDGHLAPFCFSRKRDERQVSKSSRKNMNHPSLGVHAQPIQRRPTRPRGVLLLVARPQVVRPRGGHAQRDAGRVPYGQGPLDRGFGSYFPSGPQFPFCGDRFPSEPWLFGVFPNTFQWQMPQHWYSPQFTYPSVVPFAHHVSYY